MSTAIVKDHPSIVGKTPGVWSCPDAELVLRADAEEAAWLAERRNGIGGSDASTIAGVNEWSSRYELWLDKTGQLPPKEDPDRRMAMGKKLEPVISGCFTDDTGITLRRAGLMRSKEFPWMQVTVDALASDGGVFEAKSTNWKLAHEWDDDQTADHAEVQVQHGLAVTGRTHAWVAVMIDGGWPLFRRVERDDELIATLIEMERRFWHDHVLANVAPPIDTPAALPAVKARFAVEQFDDVAAGDRDAADAVRAWLDAKAAAKQATTVEKVNEAVVRDLIGAHTGLAVHGETLVSLRQNGVFSSTKFTKDHPDIAEQFTTSKPVLDVDRLKEEHPELWTQYRARVLRPATKKEN